MNDIQPLREWLAAARTALGPDTVGLDLPVALRLAETLLEDLVEITPRVLVREEKNKGSTYHGQSTNLTTSFGVRPASLLDWNSFPSASTIDLSDALDEILVAHGGVLAPFIASVLPLDEGSDPKGRGMLMAGQPFDVQFNAFTPCGFDSDRVRTEPEPSSDAPPGTVSALISPLRLAPRDLAVWSALRTRLIELDVSENAEIYGTGVDDAVRGQNAAIRTQVLARYVAFLAYILVSYGDPHFEA